MVGYKKVTRDFQEFILTLRILGPVTRDAHGMPRTSKALVLAAHRLDGSRTDHVLFYSLYDWGFTYLVGETASADLTGNGGIHFVPTVEAARRFMRR